MGSLLLTSFVGMLAVICCVSRASATCHYNDNVYDVGDKFHSIDRCNKCVCHKTGDVACTKLYCIKCRYNGKQYNVGDNFPATDDCNQCTCSNSGDVVCTRIYCPKCKYNGQVYNVGDTFPATDGCNKCTCTGNGTVGCTKIYCPKCNYNGQTYKVGDRFPSVDGCNTCACTRSGVVACTEKKCACPAIKCAKPCYRGNVFYNGCPTCLCRQKCKETRHCGREEFCNGRECCPNRVLVAFCSDPCTDVKCPTSTKCERFCSCYATCVPVLSVTKKRPTNE